MQIHKEGGNESGSDAGERSHTGSDEGEGDETEESRTDAWGNAECVIEQYLPDADECSGTEGSPGRDGV